MGRRTDCTREPGQVKIETLDNKIPVGAKMDFHADEGLVMIRNPAIHLCLPFIPVVISTESAGETGRSDASGTQRSVPDGSNVGEAVDSPDVRDLTFDPNGFQSRDQDQRGGCRGRYLLATRWREYAQADVTMHLRIAPAAFCLQLAPLIQVALRLVDQVLPVGIGDLRQFV